MTEPLFKLDILILCLWLSILGLIPCVAGCIYSCINCSKGEIPETGVLAENEMNESQRAFSSSKVETNISKTVDSLPKNEDEDERSSDSTTQNFTTTHAGSSLAKQEEFSLERLFKMFHVIKI